MLGSHCQPRGGRLSFQLQRTDKLAGCETLWAPGGSCAAAGALAECSCFQAVHFHRGRSSCFHFMLYTCCPFLPGAFHSMPRSFDHSASPGPALLWPPRMPTSEVSDSSVFISDNCLVPFLSLSPSRLVLLMLSFLGPFSISFHFSSSWHPLRSTWIT